MPILDLQQRITERGRIRLGTKVDGTRRDGSTYTRPAKSRTFLISSHDRTVVETAAAEWADTAGQVEPFDAGFRVDTGRTELDVILPPEMMAFSQWREMWGNGYCARRCDGQRETISDGPCLCPADHEERRVLAAKGKACKDTTRLSVMLPDLPGFGLWRVESHGFYAATELAGAVQAVTHLAPNTLVRARLTAAAREVVRFDADGQPKTHKFVVPTLDLPDVRLRELMAPDGGVGVQIQSPARAGLTPVAPAALEETTSLSVADQLAVTRETPLRKNAAAVLPPTGLRPGREVSGGGELSSPTAAAPGETVPGGEPPAPSTPTPLDVDAVEQTEATPPAAAPAGPDTPEWFAGANRKARAIAKTALGADSKDGEYIARWEALVWAASGGTTTESKALTRDQHQAFTQRLKDVLSGLARVVESDDPAFLGFTLEYKEAS